MATKTKKASAEKANLKKATKKPDAKPDVIDAGGGIMVEIAAAPATAKKAKPAKKAPAEKLSQIAAAERVLADASAPMNCQQMVDAMAAQGLWSSPGGKTPAATLYASLLRIIRAKGKDAKFQKVARGQFAIAEGK